MAQDGYIGSDFAVAVNGFTLMFRTFEVRLTSRMTDFNPLDTNRVYHRATPGDCSITLTGYESDKAGAANFASLGQAQINQTPITILSWTDKGATPATRLPTDFFDAAKGFPVTGWRVTEVTGGTGSQTDASGWSITLMPNHI